MEEGIIQPVPELASWWQKTKYSEGQSSSWNPPSAEKSAAEKEANQGKYPIIEVELAQIPSDVERVMQLFDISIVMSDI